MSDMSAGPPSLLDTLRLPGGPQPLYRQLVDAIAELIAQGELVAGERLPPQREIAKSIGLNVTTVTRALSALQQRGLVIGRPGRGTVVATPDRGDEQGFNSAPADETGLIDLSVNRPATSACAEALANYLPRLPKDKRYPGVQDYQVPEGPLWARMAAAAWLAPVAGDNDPGRIVVTEGAQHALACVLAATTQPGDVLLADAVTYQGIKALCLSRGVKLRGLAMDRQGVLPDALEKACKESVPRAIFLVPSLHNPTTATLPEERRHAIVKIARQHNVLIIEDDVYRPLLEERLPSFAMLEPELTVHISGFSKCVAPGLRMGFIAAPRALVAQVAAMLRIDCWCISPLSTLIGTVLLEEGVIGELVGQQREELRLRQLLLHRVLGHFDIQTHEISTHAWLHLPDPWRDHTFARVCLRHGVRVLGSDAFAVGRNGTRDAVRINVAAARSRDDLCRALEIIAELIGSGHLHLNDVA
jgi:DNA-binding transcriptional MocR family regulator